jgi:type II secretory ATPase GspE/PulE/Tfp pilus assembly ATPase PilB-like protein
VESEDALNTTRLACGLGLFLLWIVASNWIERDSRLWGLRHRFWYWVCLIYGALSGVLLLMLPVFYAGCLMMLSSVLIPLCLYLRERQGVGPLTPELPVHKLPLYWLLWGIQQCGLLPAGLRRFALDPGLPVRILEADRSPHALPLGTHQSTNGRTARRILYQAVIRNASDLILYPTDDDVSVRMRLDGMLHALESLDPGTGRAVMNIVKVFSGLDVTDKLHVQGGNLQIQVGARRVDLRVTTQNTSDGESVCLRLLDPAQSFGGLSDLGLREPLLSRVTTTLTQPHGLILCCGPTGAGKTTTLVNALKSLNLDQLHVITVEDPIEYRIPAARQLEVSARTGQTFSNVLADVLRQDPDVIMIGEIRDAETAQTAYAAAETGHRVLTSVHANGLHAACARLTEFGIQPARLTRATSLIVHQRLIRRLCPNCREAYRPEPNWYGRFPGSPSSSQLQQVEMLMRCPRTSPAHCRCHGIGYFGRVGVFEVLRLHAENRDLIARHLESGAGQLPVSHPPGTSPTDQLLKLLATGETSLQEIHRTWSAEHG